MADGTGGTSRLADVLARGAAGVQRAQETQIAAGEQALQRTNQGLQNIAGMGERAQAREQEAQLQQQQMEQQQGQFEARQGQQQQQFEQGQAQQQAQFEQRQQLDVAQYKEQQAANTARMREMEKESARQEEELQLRREQTAAQRKKLAAETEAAHIEKIEKRKDTYRKEFNSLREMRDKLLVGGADANLVQQRLSQMGDRGKALMDNEQFKAGLGEVMGGGMNPQAAQTVLQGIDHAMVKVMVDQAGELGEWSPPPYLIDNPQVQQFNAFMTEAKMALNQQVQDTILALNADPARASEFMKLQGSPTERDARIVRTAYRSMMAWYSAQAIRSGMQRYQTQSGQGQ